MIQSMKKTVRISGRIIIAALSLLLALLILFNLLLAGSVVWLNTPAGQNWARPKIANALAGSGYDLSYNALVYSMADGLTVTDLKLSDAGGPIVDIDYASLRFHILSVAARQISLGLNAHNIVLYRLPDKAEDTAEKEPSGPLTPFDTGGLFLKSIVINDFSVRRLDLREAVIGQAMILSPRFSAKLGLSPLLDLTLNGRIGQPEDPAVAWVPRDLKLSATLDPQSLILKLAAFNVNAAAYRIDASGDAGLGEAGMINATLNLSSTDLSLLANGQAGQAELNATFSGATHDPALAAKGRVVLDRLKENGLPEILLSVEAATLVSQPEGVMDISGVYKEMPLNISTQFSYEASALTLNDIAVTGPDLSANGAVTLDTATMLAQGKLTLDAQRLETYAALTGQDIAGKAGLDILLSALDEKQAVTLDLQVDQGRYQTYRLGHADVKALIGDIKNPWPQNLDLNLRNLVLSDGMAAQKLSAQVKAAQAGYDLTVNGNGDFVRPVTLNGKAHFSDVTQAVPTIRDIDLTLKSGGSAVQLKGGVDSTAIDLKLSTRDFNPGVIVDSLPENIRAMRLNGTLDMTGPLSAPLGRMELKATPLAVAKGAPQLRLSANADYADGSLNAALKGTGDGVRRLDAQLSLPLTLSLHPFAFDLQKTAALNGAFHLDLEGGVLATTFLPPDHRFSGAIQGAGEIGGTLAAPDLQASLALRDGVYDYTPYDVSLRDMTLDAGVTRSTLSLKSFTANDGESGTMQARGLVDFTSAAGTKLSLSLDNFHIVKSDAADGTASADLQITGGNDGYLIGGAVNLGQFDIVIPEQFHSKIPQLNIVEPDKKQGPDAMKTVRLEIGVNAPNRIFVRGWGLDAEFGGELNIGGTLDTPLVNGDFESVRGRYEEFGKRFTLAHANLRFQGTVPPSPYLDIEATTDVDDITASVLLTGPVTQPGIKLSSVPALPEDEVMSRILFGKTMNKITPFQAVQLTQTLQRFSGKGGGGFDPLGQLRAMTGLDDIRVDTDEAGESSVGVGKYLTEKVYLEVEAGRGEASGAANLQIEVTPSISLESKIGQDAQGGAGIFWSRDY